MAILTEHHYGKSHVRLMKVSRHSDRHDLKELTLDVRFEGDFKAAYASGDNSRLLPTDTMRNTVYALAKNHPVDQIEEFGLLLADHFLRNNPQVSRVEIHAIEHPWTWITAAGKAHRFAFLRGASERRTATVMGTREAVTIEAGIEDLVVLKTSGSGFEGYIHDRFTTLQETRDRLLASSIQAAWIYAGREVSFGLSWHGVRQSLLDTFAEHQSRSVQHTLYAMGEAVLESHDDVAEIRISMPNRHCLLVDLSPFGLENNNEIFQPSDEPHGLIEARLTRTS